MVAKSNDQDSPRFDFGANIDPCQPKTDTAAELLKEINREYNPKSGEPANFKSLDRVLGLVHEITGESVPNSTAPVPLSTLKTIKLLFLTNHKSKRHLIGLIEPPGADNPATMEFCTGTTVSRDKKGAELIHSLVKKLEREIAPEKLAQLSELATPKDLASFSEAFISHIEQTNDTVFGIFSSQIVADSRGQANAYYALSKAIDSMNYRRSSDELTPAHEAMHCHLVTLGLQHFILHHRTFIKDILTNYRINPIADQCTHLCDALSELTKGPVDPNQKIVSVNDCPKLVAVYRKEFKSLVKAATGLDTKNSERFVENIRLAKAILASYGDRCYDESNPDVKLLSILDIVAALCSVRHQQEFGTKYPAYWPAQKSQGTNVEAMFKKGLRKNDPHQHQGVAQIYLYRFAEYQAAFTNTTESYRGWMAYQVSRLDAYARIFKLREVGRIVASARHFDEVCMQEAERITNYYASRM